jgi:hypothetical protein
MAVVADRDTFRELFPTFQLTNNKRVDLALEAAAMQVPVDVWADRAPLGVLYLAAHLLALQPGGQNVRNESKKEGYQSTTYGQQFERMLKQVSVSIERVVVNSEADLIEPP